jgi:GNAT superfamily N-acetyltransferase
MKLLIRPIEQSEMSAASLILQGGSLRPEMEDETNVEAYWNAVKETRRRKGEVLVAELNNEIVGIVQVMVFPLFSYTGSMCCELESVHVRSDLRGKGIGSQLLVKAEEFAREQGCFRIQLTSRNVRADAHRFYHNAGFEQTSQGFKKMLVKNALSSADDSFIQV